MLIAPEEVGLASDFAPPESCIRAISSGESFLPPSCFLSFSTGAVLAGVFFAAGLPALTAFFSFGSGRSITFK